MNYKHLFFLRHLRTEHNVSACINGQSIRLPVLEMRPIIGARDVDTVYCSPALRCRQTVECFSGTNSAQSIVYSDMLLERDMGKLEGQKRDAAAAHYPELFDGKQFRVFETPPEGEPFSDFMQRVRSFCANYLETASGDVVICSHNQFLKALYFIASKEQISEKRWKALSFPFGKMVPIKLGITLSNPEVAPFNA